MKISFVANFMNHHQLPFSQNMINAIGENYTFIALEPVAEEQLKLGYEDLNQLPFVIKAYENNDLYNKALEKINNDDMVIFGSCPNSLIDMRLKQNKLSILYTERFFKKGLYRRFIPVTYYKIYDRILRHKNRNIHIICSSAYAPFDFKLLGYKNPIYKWGYFPEVIKYDINELIKSKKSEKIKILWVGRFLKLKHAEDAIDAVKKISQHNENIEFNIIGRGVLENKLKAKVLKNNMSSFTNFLGSMSPDQVRKYMEQSNIFIFSSDFNEGWGAVMNEAMNSGCAVIASHAVGSVPFLIKDGENGLVYKNRDRAQLYNKLKLLVDDEALRSKLGKNAYYTLAEQWNAETATKRLLEYISDWHNEKNISIYEDGPCSVANILNHKWY